MSAEEFERTCLESFNIAKQTTPIDTGNMRYNALKIEFLDGGNTCHIYIDEDIAPYVFYTNEPWVSPKWDGKENPNENWWQDRYFKTFISEFKRILGDKIAEIKETQ